MPCSDDPCHIPVPIEPDEHLIRVVKSPFHFHSKRKNELIPKVFHPAPGKSDVSVIRQIMGDDFCADKARSIASEIRPPAQYNGLLIVEASDVNEVGSCAYDDRDGQFCGHAHINHGVTMPLPGETLAPEERQKLDERCKALLARKKAHEPDQLDSGPGWHGRPLR